MALTLNSPGSNDDLDIQVTKEEYNYPFGNNLKPDSALHTKLISRIGRMVDESYSVMEKRHSSWNQIDETLRAYVKLSDYENQVKAKDERKPVSIVVPYSYATLETIMAYLTNVHLESDVFSYEGNAPEDTVPSKLLELVVNQQVNRYKSTLEMHTAMRDSLAYGLGVSTLNWKQMWGKKAVVKTIPQFSLLGNSLAPNRIKTNEDALLFEGNEVITIDPYRLLPDPNVSIHNLQQGEFFGWVEFQSVLSLESDEAVGDYFNVSFVKARKEGEKETKFSLDKSSRIMKRDDRRTPNSTQYVSIVNMYITLVPKEWGLKTKGDGRTPEIWLFTVVNDSIIVRAKPLGLNHNMYPVAAAAPDYDGYSITPLARMELIGGLQTTLNWLFNSHIANVRKAINDMFIVDPSLINMEDLKDPEPGKLIRLRRSAWGRGVENSIKQFAVNDITKQNMNDAYTMMDLMQKASAASDTTMGVMRNGGERVTAQEYSGTMSAAVSRLDHISRIVSMQYLQDLAYFHASHTQQLMTQDVYVKSVGEWPEVLEAEYGREISMGNRVKVSPFDLVADFDIIFKDNSTTKSDSLANDFWVRSLQILTQNPILAQKFDIVRIFKHMARINGAKNVGDFINKGGGNVTTMPNETVAQEAQAGNMVPADELAALLGQIGESGGSEQESMAGF